MIYAYFDANRVLKELINDTVNSGDMNVNKIAVYWEDDNDGYSSGIRYQMVNRSYHPATMSDLILADNKESLEIPYNRKQDLKYFKYGVKYGDPDFPNTHKFRVFTIPDIVLANETDDAIPVLVSVFIGYQDNLYTLDRFAFNVGPSTVSVYMDEHINLAEWNALVNIVFNKQLYVVQNYSNIVVANHKNYDMFFVVSEQKFYYIDGTHALVELNIGGGAYVIDNEPTESSENLVYSGGIYSWVLSQLAQLETTKAHICTSASDTPSGVTWGGITGTLLAGDAHDGFPGTIFFVPDGNGAYIEYFPILVTDYYSWEIIGKTSIDLPDTPQQDGKYELMVNIATGVASYSWSDESEFVITSSGTSFDLTDNRYKLKTGGKVYSYIADGKYACISSPTTLSMITVNSSTYVWTITSQSVTANTDASFTIGAITYTIPTVAAVVTVSDGGTADYNLLLAHKDYLLQISGDDELYHLIKNDEAEGMLYYSNIVRAGTNNFTYTLISVENVASGNVAVTNYTLNNVVANPTGTPSTWLDKITIGTNSYNVALPEIIDLGTASSGTLTQAQYNRLMANPSVMLKNYNEYLRLVDDGSTVMTYSNLLRTSDDINGRYLQCTITKANRNFAVQAKNSLMVTGLVANPAAAATEHLSSVNIKGIVYDFNEIIDLGTSNGGALTQEQYDRLIVNPGAMIKYDDIYFKYSGKTSTLMFYTSIFAADAYLANYQYININISTKAYTINLGYYLLTNQALVANMTLSGNEQELTSLRVKGTNYRIGGKIETFTISSWTADANISPYTYKATITLSTTLSADTIVELINDNAISFATYGFAIGLISGQVVTIYALSEPDSSITLKIKVGV